MTSTEVVPVDATAIEQVADPAQYVELACERAKTWLANALEHGEIDQIAELKCQAEAMRIYTTQKQLGKDAELSAQEIVRRAERGLGLVVRQGQERGDILRGGETARRPIHHPGSDPTRMKASARDYFKNNEEWANTYAVTDGVSDEQYETALDEAKAERNLSRANVVRKVKGENKPKPTERPDVLYKTRHIDSNRVVEQTILSSGISQSIAEQIDYTDLDRDCLEEWLSSLSAVIKSLTTLRTNLRKELNRDQV